MTTKKQKVYLVCGVAGAGKSWVCSRLEHLIHYHPSDTLGKKDPTRTLELHDRTCGTSTTIKRWRSMGIEVIPVFVMGDFLQVKQQLINRGGKITKGLYSRWKRMKVVAKQYSVFTGSSSEVLKWLKQELSYRNEKHIIYKATSPSGKIYIGKTQQGLKRRIYDHIVHAKSNTTKFSKAIRKYGDQIKWETIEEVNGLEAANQAEIKWIQHYKSTDSQVGYNLTEGGDGGKRSEEAEDRRVQAIKKTYTSEDIREKNRQASFASWDKNKDKISSAIKAVRSTEESRAKTRKQMEEQSKDPDWRAKISSKNIERYQDTEERDRTSAAGLKARERLFAAYRDGMEVGRWTNQKFAAADLNLKQCAISRVLGGSQKSTGGYTFKYL